MAVRGFAGCAAGAMLLAAVAHAATWEPLGPYGGNTQSVAVDPQNPATVYLGVYTGGVWKSTDRGGTWSPTGPGPDAVYALVIDPSTPTTLYASGYQVVSRSLDGGATWVRINPGLLYGQTVYALAIDPVTPSTVYAGAAVFAGPGVGGILKSIDGGTSWTPMSDGLTDRDVYSLAVDPVTPSTVYAGTETGVFKSIDGGAVWAPTGVTDAQDVRALAVDSANPNILYAGAEDGVRKSSDAGASWVGIDAATVGRSVFSLVIDPSDHAVVYAGSRLDGIFKTTDGGATWTRTEGSVPTEQLAIDPGDPRIVYATHDGVYKTQNGGLTWVRSQGGLRAHDLVSLVADPRVPGHLYGSSFGILYATADDGATWVASHVPTSDTFYLAVEPSRGTIVFVTRPQFNYAGYWTRRIGKPWHPARGLATNQASSVVADPVNRGVMYAGTFDGIFKSRNGGRRWKSLPASPHGIGILGLAVDPGSAAVYAATGSDSGVFKTTDGGSTWDAMNTGLGESSLGAVALGAGDPATVYVGANAFDRIFRSVDGGLSWTEGSAGLPQGGVYEFGIVALLVDPLVPTTVYAGIRHGGIYRSTDGGDTWSRFTPGMAVDIATGFTFSPAAPSVIYVGTPQGAFRLTGP